MDELVKIGERLKLFLEAEKIKPNMLARLSGNSSTQIYNVLKGQKYGTDKFIQIIAVLPKLNIYWLVSGEGNMYKSTEPAVSSGNNNTAEKEKIAQLEKEIRNLEAMMALQEMTVNAYKRTSEMAESSMSELKRMVEFYRERAENKESKKSA